MAADAVNDPIPPDAVGPGFPAAVRAVLEHVRERLDLESWLVARRRGDEYLVLATAPGAVADPGDTKAWIGSLCDLAARDLAPRIAPDVDEVPTYRSARDALGIQVRAFVSIPLLDSTGEVLGCLCGVSPQPRDASLLAARELLEVLGGLLGSLLDAELQATAADRRAVSAEQLADTDELTGLVNRRGWDRALVAEDARCIRYGSAAAVVVADLDGLKAVNDTRGHAAGDLTLRRASRVLSAQIRASDVAARLGGDEFGLLLTECDLSTATELGERTREALTRAGVSASVGLAARGTQGLTAAWALADQRMNAEKRRHRAICARGTQEAAAVPVPAAPVVAPPAPAPVEDTDLIPRLVALVRERLGADIAFLARVDGGHRIMRHLSSARPLSARPGDAEPFEATLCARILDGRLPQVIPDTALEPAALELAVTRGLPIGAYVGVPVTLPDGRLYGTLCCLNHGCRGDLGSSDVAFLEAIASTLAHALAEEERERAHRTRTLADLDGITSGLGLQVRYQPLCRLADRIEVGVEALSRFATEPERSPDEWFAQAARFGRGVELELLAAGLALDGAAAYGGLLALNLSPLSICAPGLPGLLEGRDLARLVLEISEHERVDDYGWLEAALTPWREAGLRVAVDDAGTGFTSLRHVMTLSPEFIKLDISLVRRLETDPVRQALVRAMTGFASDAGAELLAKGVETEPELHILLEEGVTLGQGWLLGRPAPLAPLSRAQRTPSRSTTKTNVSFGPIAPPAPRAP